MSARLEDYDVDIEEIMDREVALQAGIDALEIREKHFESVGMYNSATRRHIAANILQRMMDEIEEADLVNQH